MARAAPRDTIGDPSCGPKRLSRCLGLQAADQQPEAETDRKDQHERRQADHGVEAEAILEAEHRRVLAEVTAPILWRIVGALPTGKNVTKLSPGLHEPVTRAAGSSGWRLSWPIGLATRGSSRLDTTAHIQPESFTCGTMKAAIAHGARL